MTSQERHGDSNHANQWIPLTNQRFGRRFRIMTNIVELACQYDQFWSVTNSLMYITSIVSAILTVAHIITSGRF